MTQKNIERFSFFILLALVSIAFVSLLQGFLVALFWAVAFAILFAPLAQRVRGVIGERDSLVSVVTVLVVMVAVVIPLIGLGFAVAGETARLMAELDGGDGIDLFARAEHWVRERLPDLVAVAQQYGIDIGGLRDSLSSAAMVSGQWVASNAVRAGTGTLNFTLSLFLMIYLLYFFLRDGTAIIDRLVQVLPLGDERERALFARFAQVVRATVKGTFVIGAVQGLIGGVTFAFLGINGAILWGVLMALLSLLPAVGAALVWVPAAVMLFAREDYVGGGILVFVGVAVIGLADNLLRPLLVGRDTRMPDYLILLATLGGLGTYGVSGMIIGPLIAALFITVWEMFEASFGVQEGVFAGLADDVPDGPNPPFTTGIPGLSQADTQPENMISVDDELPDPGLDNEFRE